MRYNYDKHNSYNGIVSRCENVTRMNPLGRFSPAYSRVYLRANQDLDVDRFLAGARNPLLNRQCRLCTQLSLISLLFFHVHLYLGIIAVNRGS